jgi:hypothetical protein
MKFMPRTLVTLLLLLVFGCAAAAPPALSGDAVGSVQIGMRASALPGLAHVTSDRMEPDSEGGEVHQDKVWRIEVPGPGPRTRTGLGVGTPLTTLLKLPKLQGEIGEGALYVWSPQHCGLSFRLSHELRTDKNFQVKWNARSLASLPPTVTVHSLLVTGCAK